MQDPPVATLVGAMSTAGDLINPADTSWMLVATALVLLMTPALAFFYGGLVRSKNVLNTMMMSLASLGAVGIAWVVAGYSLAFAPGNGWIGGGAHLFLTERLDHVLGNEQTWAEHADDCDDRERM